ncbi:uncharacterized protein LOC117224163 [Megalopta genalis]|uniref:uncharacterized protein LOC117224163 n=1 Tax=Megalopta genalis TaxID=115081 RepID=UPI00144318EE|nr:uncharacterized protein LOC117224163 [Megalopta genalis]
MFSTDNGTKDEAKFLQPLKNDSGDLSKSWCCWRSKFLNFLKYEDESEICKNSWGNYLLMFIGPIGQEAYKIISTNDVSLKDNFNALLLKFDIYFIYKSKKLQPNENINEYVNDLKKLATDSNHPDIDCIVKEKLINDITTAGHNAEMETYLRSLTLSEITSELATFQNFKKDHCKIDVPKKTVKQRIIIDCIRCGKRHTHNNCPAHGKQCDTCKKFNHFTENCKSSTKFVENCSKCGTNHKQIECPAFGYTCCKCGKSNHYSWKCQMPVIKNCPRCGTDHAKSLCPAQGKVCTKCNKPNHFEIKCISK